MSLVREIDNRLKSWRIKPQAMRGLPEALDFDSINSLSNDLLGEGIYEVSYSLLSGWKSTGAYRVYIKATNGRTLSIIFKNALYSLDNIPALEGLGVFPGPAECIVYDQSNDRLREFLPDIYLLKEVTPRKHYQYLMEDLEHSQRRLPRNSKNILVAIRELVDLHNALAEWKPSTADDFIDYGQTFSESLLEYAQRSIEHYARSMQDQLVLSVLSNWDDLVQVYSSDEFSHPPEINLIHGDFHPWNIHISRRVWEKKIKLIDWEWLGFGRPHADLASLLAQESSQVEEQGLKRYSQLVPSLSFEQHTRWYEWCRLQRGILDAAFLIKQHESSDRVASWVQPFIQGSLKRVNQAVHRLN